MGRAAAAAVSCDGGRDWADSDSTVPAMPTDTNRAQFFLHVIVVTLFVLSDTPALTNGNVAQHAGRYPRSLRRNSPLGVARPAPGGGQLARHATRRCARVCNRRLL